MSNHELTTLEASRRWGVSERRVDQYCAEGRVPGARKVGGSPRTRKSPGTSGRSGPARPPGPSWAAAASCR